MSQNINAVTITGNLTRDPSLRDTNGGGHVCSLRIAVNGRVKRAGEWEDKVNYFDVAVFGRQGEATAEHMQKGSPVAITGRLDWSEWTDKEGNKRQGVAIIANDVQFLPDSSSGDSQAVVAQTPHGVVPSDDDIPF
jgi:single-strand DNA-binding protein